MAYINVAEWSPDQVTEWLKGLDDSMYCYIQSFTNNEVGGQQLLNIRPHELEQLGMQKIGHQEIVLEAVEHLRNFHYHLDKENLQFLALQVATAARCLYKQLAYCDKTNIETQFLNDITRTIATIKPLICWLDRAPFQDQVQFNFVQFNEIRTQMLKYSLEMATSAQRDRFVENPVEQIKKNAEKLAKFGDYIIQDITDPMILQPSTLDLITLKKRESELGFYIIPSFHGIHRITDIKYNSPAHNSGKMEEGDEIVQINYQTIVGWEYKKVILQLQESPTEVLLTLKKRPKHTKIYGQIYMKPYRLPSKKRVLPNRNDDSLQTPRTDSLSVQSYPIPTNLNNVQEKNPSSDSDSSCSDILTPTNVKPSIKDLRLYLRKPRSVLQRRNTICGDQVTSFKSLANEEYWEERKDKIRGEESPSLRDKSVSFNFGLELAPRPTTCLGITVNTNGNANKFNEFSGLKGSLPEMISELKPSETDADKQIKKSEDKCKPGVSKVVRFDSNMKLEEYPVDNKYTCNIDNTILETFEPIPYVDDEMQALEKNNSSILVTHSQPQITRMTADTGLTQAVNIVLVKKENIRRGKLDKSHSAPTYDASDDDSDSPPAIEPRNEYLLKVPPAPPPRPKKTFENNQPSTSTSVFINPQINNAENMDENKSKMANVIDLKNKDNCQNIIDVVSQNINSPNESEDPVNKEDEESNKTVLLNTTNKKMPTTKHFLEERFEALELLTPNKTKSLTLKKKNSILAKRRKISLKTLGISDIQGHLFRRSKDKHGVTYWAKLYFVLVDTALYGFKSKESVKAASLIFLQGFTISLANEVHSKQYAFKVYHSTKTFYFAAETKEALAQWMEYIKQATLKGNVPSQNSNIDHDVKDLFTETDSSGDELEIDKKPKFDFLSIAYGNAESKNHTNKNDKDGDSTSVTKHEKYHLGFGSLKKFTKSNLPFSSSKNSDKKNSSEVPVPTAQFRSYRKVPGNAGLQLGTNSMVSINAEQTNTLSPTHQTDNLVKRKTSITSMQTLNEYNNNNINNINKDVNNEFDQIKIYNRLTSFSKSRKTQRTSPHNYIHASNPNLVEFDFQTSKTLDLSMPKINPGNSWEAHNNLQGLLTLKDLMLQKQAEEAQEVYNNRVYLGVEKKDDRNLRKKYSKNERDMMTGSYDTSNKSIVVVDKIQSRSLPKTPDYAQSFKLDDGDIIMTRSKEGLKLRDFGYESISGDDPSENRINHHPDMDRPWKRNDKISPAASLTKKKVRNWISNTNDKKSEEDKTSRQGSLKKTKNKLVGAKIDNLRTSSEKIFLFKPLTNDKDINKQLDKNPPLKSTTSYVPTTLPINKKQPHLFNIHSEQHQVQQQAPLQILPTSSTTHIKKSITNNTISDIKDNLLKDVVSERSASYFTKLTFSSNKSTKEKKLLGSPRLHRTIFGHRNNQINDGPLVLDHEIFSPISYAKTPSLTSENSESLITLSKLLNPSSSSAATSPTTPAEQTSSTSLTATTSTSGAGTPDYPNMEYPPVFEPATYSLCDPNTSLTLLRRRNHNQSK